PGNPGRDRAGPRPRRSRQSSGQPGGDHDQANGIAHGQGGRGTAGHGATPWVLSSESRLPNDRYRPSVKGDPRPKSTVFGGCVSPPIPTVHPTPATVRPPGAHGKLPDRRRVLPGKEARPCEIPVTTAAACE